MNEQAYELTALIMRYWFALLIIIAVLCALRLQAVEHRRAKREKAMAPNMEYIGELLVVRGTDEVAVGERFAIQRDIVIGRRRKCDVRLNDGSVLPRHAWGELRGYGMVIGAIGRAPVALRGQPLAQEIFVKSGALFCIGAITLRLVIYDLPVNYDRGEAIAIDAARADEDSFDADLSDYEGEYSEYDCELPEFTKAAVRRKPRPAGFRVANEAHRSAKNKRAANAQGRAGRS